MTYTTQDLIQFLAGERDACMDGKRLKLSPTNTGFTEEALAILQEKGIQQIGAYHDFRTEIWKYQAQHLISGLGATRFCGVRQKDLAQSPTEFCRQPSRTAEAILI